MNRLENTRGARKFSAKLWAKWVIWVITVVTALTIPAQLFFKVQWLELAQWSIEFWEGSYAYGLTWKVSTFLFIYLTSNSRFGWLVVVVLLFLLRFNQKGREKIEQINRHIDNNLKSYLLLGLALIFWFEWVVTGGFLAFRNDNFFSEYVLYGGGLFQPIFEFYFWLSTVNERAIAFIIMFWRLCEIVILFAWVGFLAGEGEVEKKADRQWALYLTTFLIEGLITFVRGTLIYVALLIPVFLILAFSRAIEEIPDMMKLFSDTGYIAGLITYVFVPLNLLISALIVLGLNIPIERVKLSFDSREPVNDEKGFIINFYRKLEGDESVFVSWNVIESAGVFAFTYGRAIFISRGAFTDSTFNALVAHELGHLKNGDGVILQALHSFTYPFFNHLLFNPSSIQRGVVDLSEQRQNPNFLLSGFVANLSTTLFTIIFGGWGIQVFAKQWSRYFINQDYKADEYAVNLGFGYELDSYLENYKDFDTNLPLFNRWRGYTRVRLEKIQELMQSKLSEREQ